MPLGSELLCGVVGLMTDLWEQEINFLCVNPLGARIVCHAAQAYTHSHPERERRGQVLLSDVPLQ